MVLFAFVFSFLELSSLRKDYNKLPQVLDIRASSTEVTRSDLNPETASSHSLPSDTAPLLFTSNIIFNR